MVPCLLDTNTVSDIIRAPAKRHASVTAHASLVTSNTKHFDWIPGLQLFDWRQA